MVKVMAVLNLTPDSFWEESRYDFSVLGSGADIVDIGAVSTRPGASPVSEDEEWRRLQPVLSKLPQGILFSVDTTRSSIVQRVYELCGDFIVNDISAGEDDPQMLPLVGKLGLSYIAMHKRGNPQTMDSLAQYDNVIEELKKYFTDFSKRAAKYGIDDWILDPGLGFAKTPRHCWQILENLGELKSLGHPILIGAADKRFTAGDNTKAHRLAIENGADIIRVHNVKGLFELLKEYHQIS